MKGIVTHVRYIPFAVFQAMNADADNTQTIVPRLDDLMVDPFPVCGVGTNEHNRASPSLHLAGNPALDRVVTAPFSVRTAQIQCEARVTDRPTNESDMHRSRYVRSRL